MNFLMLNRLIMGLLYCGNLYNEATHTFLSIELYASFSEDVDVLLDSCNSSSYNVCRPAKTRSAIISVTRQHN
ncbi:hypothetical protein WALSEDRAFT_60698 [Wallemia mellicola CBS 633.66]|uniref:Secreted protein n=1 Tax=Wallemia mellicola (strain ATCC MYA-4683 / CBS 633.66) TaxID=671144 RepID=I4Y9Z2_WALMC|nr:hypothetical protein WALSEDRAFT_60698 [Wallemia mellicola CBS 633.66]EIM20784.1 hypothetical protein WALSEDRAFT_60698 [Wallemia mellicola CBS 633.66]|eukprot:XP_006959050.1 hypothetical protein WALSEDRAFT_60698 [Wallemia mellicola CBS 633.66]